MRAILVCAAMIGCGGSDAPLIDGGVTIDASVIDARPEFFGEPCELPLPNAVRTCHCSRIEDNHCYDPQGFCVDERHDGVGVCRPWCDQINPTGNATYVCIGAHEGGTPTWSKGQTSTEPGNVCVCLPP